MYGWERDALGIGTLGEIRGSVPTEMTIEVSASSRAAWWISTLFGPDFWTHWRVGLLRPTILGTARSPIAPPDPLLLSLPGYVGQKMAAADQPQDFIAVCPAIVEEKALAFAVVGTTAEEEAGKRVEPRERWALVAPSDLTHRLKLVDGARSTCAVAARFLSGRPPAQPLRRPGAGPYSIATASMAETHRTSFSDSCRFSRSEPFC